MEILTFPKIRELTASLLTSLRKMSLLTPKIASSIGGGIGMSGWSLALSKNTGRRDVGSKINQEIAIECFHVTSRSHVGVP